MNKIQNDMQTIIKNVVDKKIIIQLMNHYSYM